MLILIIDDDVLSVKLISFLLQDTGYRVLQAYDGKEALLILRKYQPNLVLLDVSMPQMDGFEVCRWIRRTSDVPIIFLTAHANLEERVLGLQTGGDDYIVKPFDPHELLARIEAVLRRKPSESVTTPLCLTRGHTTLDPLEHKVTFADSHSVMLTPIECRLLYYLMCNAGRVLLFDQILDHIWEDRSTTGRNLIAAYIHRLRIKIEPDITHPHYILTVPDLGYKFAVCSEELAETQN